MGPEETNMTLFFKKIDYKTTPQSDLKSYPYIQTKLELKTKV